MDSKRITYVVIFGLIFLAVPLFTAGWISDIDWIQFVVAVGGVIVALFFFCGRE